MCVGVVECAPDSLPPRILSLTHARRMDGFCKPNADQLASLAGLSFPAVCVGVVECTPASHARFVAFLGTFARPAQQVWLPGNDIQDPTTWDAPPLCTLKRLHGDLLQQYDCTEQAAPPPPPPSAGGGAAANAGAHPQPPAGSQDTINGKLLLPQLDRLHLAFKHLCVWHV